jgi:hypothetical protein
MSCSLQQATILFEKALAKNLITRRGAYYFYGSKNLGNSKDDATSVIMSDDDMIAQLDINVTESAQPTIVVGETHYANDDIETLGVKKHTLRQTSPVTRTVGGEEITEVLETTKTEFLEQPIIDLTGAKILAVPKEDWHPYKYSTRIDGKFFNPKELMTTVPKSGRWKNRRFMLLKSEWNNL